MFKHSKVKELIDIPKTKYRYLYRKTR